MSVAEIGMTNGGKDSLRSSDPRATIDGSYRGRVEKNVQSTIPIRR